MKNISVKSQTPTSTKDSSKVRLGNMSPAFRVTETPTAAVDKQTVRLGNMSPAFRV